MDLLEKAREVIKDIWEWFMAKPLYIKFICAFLVIIILILDTLIIVFHKKLLHQLLLASQYWESLGFKGQLVIGGGIFIVSFPLLGGFTLLVTIAGIVYGVSKGLILVAISSTLGSVASFLSVKLVFREEAERLVERYPAFKIMTIVVRDSETSSLQEIIAMALIRVLPLPYSITNCAVACVPDASAICYAIATFVSSPKNAVALFVGHQMRKLGEDETGGSKWVDFGIILLTGISYIAVSATIYNIVKRRIEEQHQCDIQSNELDLTV